MTKIQKEVIFGPKKFLIVEAICREIRVCFSFSFELIRTDPAFQRTRENMAEFGRAGKASKVVRRFLQKLIAAVSDRRMVNIRKKDYLVFVGFKF